MNNGVPMFGDELKGIGAATVRIWLNWGEIEASDDTYDWAELDTTVGAANERDIEVLGYFYNMPDWAKDPEDPNCGTDGSKSADPCEILDWADYEEFARDLAERYDGEHGHGEIQYIELWNEVQGFAQLSPEEYGPWLTKGYQAVKEGNPEAQVVLGAVLAPLDNAEAPEFMDGVLRDYAEHYDIFNFHIYGVSLAGTEIVKQDAAVAATIDYVKDRMESHRVQKPIWLTETAAFHQKILCNDLAWQQDVAKSVVRRYAQALGMGVDRTYWYAFTGLPTEEESPAGVPCGEGANFTMGTLAWLAPKGSGLAEDELHPRPAYDTYALMTRKLAGFTSVERITDTQYELVVGGKSVHVLWCETGACTLPASIPDRATITNHLGEQETMAASEITLTESPIFVE